MKWQTDPSLIYLRNLARQAGLTRVIGRMLPQRGYEAEFNKELFEAIKEGDIVWDVGANVGYYTKLFSEATGPSGQVFAFEPFPATAQTLKDAVIDLPNVSVNEFALGRSSGNLVMKEGVDDIGATNRIVNAGMATVGTEISVLTGDEVLSSGLAEIPNILKIDTEGFELDVLQGMSELMNKKNVRAIFVEVHFGLLTERGMSNAPCEIERLLVANGFETRWVDPSHVAGIRN